ncbi:hypothetical protein [Sphingobacterium corticis]|uniref:hypothetical protein n=1 Tax=Sphingobacterium corticis TaxID=1812823 RepID=UPI0036D33A50
METSVEGDQFKQLNKFDFRLRDINSCIESRRKDGKAIETKDAFRLGYIAGSIFSEINYLC